MPNVHWICYHGLFDFAYMLRLACNETYLPEDELAFQSALQLYFPNAYDVKTLAAPWSYLQGSLSRLCQELDITRIGTQHQAGSDSLVTALAFFKLKNKYYNKEENVEKYKNELFGMKAMNELSDEYPLKECSWHNVQYTFGGWVRQVIFMGRHNINPY
eukprot:TRINITY_DN5048_c0_g4_i1.p1 TRINITY_DN5048_c0_g4~~TRINITY_DN5048_c0_g4_i1.p1  ORF type:complete len:159 (+),score=10.10 TRINITY_DN5048_c0_g4_i1:743-1219(+)